MQAKEPPFNEEKYRSEKYHKYHLKKNTAQISLNWVDPQCEVELVPVPSHTSSLIISTLN